MRRTSRFSVVVACTAILSLMLLAAPAFAASLTSVTLSGGAGTATVGSTLYARQSQTVSLSVVTTSAACKVVLTGDHTGTLTSPSSSTSTSKTWNFTGLAVDSGNGTRSITVAASKLNNAGNNCNSADGSSSVSYVADNGAPTIAGAYSAGAPNVAGWSNQDVTVNWSGSDTSSGFVNVSTGAAADRNPKPSSTTHSAETTGTTLTSSGVDRVGNSGTGSVTVKLDKTKPTVTVPTGVTAEATSSNGAAVSYSTSAGDALSGPSSITPSCSKTSGSTFALGSTTVSCSAADAAGNTQTRTFDVSVVDATGPSFTNVPQIASAEGDTLGGKNVSWTDPTATDLVSGDRPVSCSPASGTLFAVGTTPVTCSATDAAGNSRSAGFSVVITDSAAPALVVPGNFDTEATGSDGAAVTFTATADDIVDGEITPVCLPASGTLLDLGSHPVNCTATDRSGNRASDGFTASVVDTTAPEFGAAPVLDPFEATGPGGAEVTYTAPSASDTVDGPVAVTCLPASGSTLSIGAHTVRCNARDAAGNDAEELTFPVIVQDTTKPRMTGVSANIIREATGANGREVSYDPPTAEDIVDGVLSVSCDRASGSTFPIAATVVTCSATDTAGNTQETSFTVTIEDTTAPEISATEDITAEATSAAGADVTYVSPTATDAVAGTPAVNCLPSSGSTFELGHTTVECTSTDGVNEGRSSFKVIVQDTTKPELSNLPADISVDATSSDGAAVTYSAPTATDTVDRAPAVGCAPTSGSTFSVGTTTVTCTATDTAGNQRTGTFNVTVADPRDTEAPVLGSMPANVLATATSANGAVVTYSAPTATDNKDASPSVSCTRASGSTFALGTTTVSCTATDASDNTSASRSFTVTVRYSSGGVLQPINSDGSSKFKLGSTMPVKIKLSGASALTPNAVISLTNVKMTGTIEGEVLESASTATPHSGDTLRYDSGSDQYIFNLSTKNLSAGTFKVSLNLGDGSNPRTASYSIVK